jgi:biotin transporter BioY
MLLLLEVVFRAAQTILVVAVVLVVAAQADLLRLAYLVQLEQLDKATAAVLDFLAQQVVKEVAVVVVAQALLEARLHLQ